MNPEVSHLKAIAPPPAKSAVGSAERERCPGDTSPVQAQREHEQCGQGHMPHTEATSHFCGGTPGWWGGCAPQLSASPAACRGLEHCTLMRDPSPPGLCVRANSQPLRGSAAALGAVGGLVGGILQVVPEQSMEIDGNDAEMFEFQLVKTHASSNMPPLVHMALSLLSSPWSKLSALLTLPLPRSEVPF